MVIHIIAIIIVAGQQEGLLRAVLVAWLRRTDKVREACCYYYYYYYHNYYYCLLLLLLLSLLLS